MTKKIEFLLKADLPGTFFNRATLNSCKATGNKHVAFIQIYDNLKHKCLSNKVNSRVVHESGVLVVLSKSLARACLHAPMPLLQAKKQQQKQKQNKKEKCQYVVAKMKSNQDPYIRIYSSSYFSIFHLCWLYCLTEQLSRERVRFIGKVKCY